MVYLRKWFTMFLVLYFRHRDRVVHVSDVSQVPLFSRISRFSVAKYRRGEDVHPAQPFLFTGVPTDRRYTTQVLVTTTYHRAFQASVTRFGPPAAATTPAAKASSAACRLARSAGVVEARVLRIACSRYRGMHRET